MATSKCANTYNRQGWEDSDFPSLCQTCLGDNPYLRMTKEKYAKECKICARPFTVFRWCPGAKMRFKKTEICQTCAKLKNVCQTCLFDLQYGLPVQVRDEALKMKDETPKSDVNKEYYMQNAEKQLADDNSMPGGALGKAAAPSDMLLKLARTTPYYKRNRPHICSFWVKGHCKRGEECPYRHEKPTDPDDPLAEQNIKDRFYGQNDPVANKLLNRYSTLPKLTPPEDRSITTLYLGTVSEDVTEEELRDQLYEYGEIRSVHQVKQSQCAFVQFTTREGAEAAAEKAFNKIILHGKRVNMKWGKSQGQQGGTKEGGAAAEATAGPSLVPVPGLPAALPPVPDQVGHNFFNLTLPPPPMQAPMQPPPRFPMHRPMRPPMPPMGMRMPGIPPPPPGTMPLRPPPPGLGQPFPHRGAVHYPSQDPSRMGARGAGDKS